MKTLFKVKPISFKTLQELPKAWDPKQYIDLLEIMDYGNTSDISAEDLKEMCTLLLIENEPEEAAKILLTYCFRDKLTSGQIENLSNEMIAEKMWEEYADLSLHEQFFNISQLLYQAYNGTFPHPEAVIFNVEITTKNTQDLDMFTKNTEARLIPILVNGMPQNTLIKRLFQNKLDDGSFEEAQHIIWQLNYTKTDNNTLLFNIISSSYWFKDFKYAEAFETEINLS